MPDNIFQISGVTYLLFYIFVVATSGYALGRVSIKGVSLGTSGVFIVALFFGFFFYEPLERELAGYTKSALKIVENIGLVLFVTSVGYMSGPGFFRNLKKNARSYFLTGILIIGTGGVAAVICILLGRQIGIDNSDNFTALVSGLVSGALTSTPAFSVAKETVNPLYEDTVAAGHGIAYLFGVIGVVVFVQIVPKLLNADMEKERKLLNRTHEALVSDKTGGTIKTDSFGIMPFSCAIILGIVIGSVHIPITARGYDGSQFALTSTGGCLLASLLLGHLGRIGKINITPEQNTLKVFREAGLMFFLLGAGISGGSAFLKNFHVLYFFFGAFITVLPMVVGYLFARYALKLNLLDNLGAIAGGMTSTPALGVLINTAGTDDVTDAYAAVYPVALVSLTFLQQLIILVF